MTKERGCDVDHAAIGLTEMRYLRRKQQESTSRLCLDGKVQPTSLPLFDAAAHIQVGSYYEIDHSQLSRRSPAQLKSIRIVMVSKKTNFSVSIRFPSTHSLRSRFCNLNRRELEMTKLLPALDEKHVMGSELAGELLYRRIPSHEIAVKGGSWSFWVVAGDDCKAIVTSSALSGGLCRALTRNDFCYSALRSEGMIKWGRRRQVQYLSRINVEEEKKSEAHSGKQAVASNVKLEEEEKDKEGEEEREEEEEAKETEESNDCEENSKRDNESRGSVRRNNNRKRKKNGTSSHSSTRRAKRTRCEKRHQITVYKEHNTKKKVLNFIDRWSVERYKLAEKNMLKVLRDKNAVFGNPILRPALRAEARKLIGDTGLLDHLLKHMAGKVAPGGQERFRRRHNSDGAMEYWLESADLMNIRKEAGVQDLYWTPPPGWKLGDSPTQDPVCAKGIREIKEEIANLKREMGKLVSKKQEEELAIVATPSSCVESQNLDHDNLSLPVKEMYMDLLKRKAQIEEQLMRVSESLHEMEEEMSRLKPIAEETGPSNPNSTQTPLLLMGSSELPTLPTNEVEAKKAEIVKQDSLPCKTLQPLPKPASAEEKAAKIERLKSGFRICKPKGSFLWPDKAASVSPIHHQYHVVAPAPLYATSSPSISPPSHHLLSPAAQPLGTHHPLVEKRPVIVTIPLPFPCPETPLNLNEAPKKENETGFLSSQNQGNYFTNPSDSPSLTYHRRNHIHSGEN